MNTYYNEITAKPVNIADGKILYKIPAGAMCANGDLAVVFDNDENGLVIHLSKCDFWKFTAGAHSDGGIKTVGEIRIGNVNLQDYRIQQYFDEGLLDCSFRDVDMQLFVAPENRIYFEIANPAGAPLPTVSVTAPDTCQSINTHSETDGIVCSTRRFDGKEVTTMSAVAVCLCQTESHTADGVVRTRYCVSVVTNFDDENYTAKAHEKVLSCDYDRDKNRTAEKWKTFFSASKVTIQDKQIETFYNASLYHLAGCMGNKGFPPGLFGNFITDDFFPWAGDYHMNYNYEAPYYCIFTSNHPELFDGYMTPINEMREDAKRFANLFGCNGYALPVSFGPMAMDVYSQPDCKEHGILFLGQKSNAAYACVIPLMHWYSTRDKDYAKDNYYDFVFGTAAFWEEYLVKEHGKYVIRNDAAHEIPYYRGKKFNALTHIGQIHTVNAINSLGLVKMLFKGVYDMAKELGLNSEKYALWEDINRNLSDFPLFIKNGKLCFRYSRMGIRWRDDNTVGLQHIYPASQIGFNSGDKLLKIARNSYFINDRRLDDNGSNSYLPAGARIGVDPAFIMEGIRSNIKEFAMPNKLFRHHGGGIEHLTTVPATINEMLLQSYEGIIRLFPCWDKNSDASFENLRADGAFLVSAKLQNKRISGVSIRSLQGNACKVQDFGFSRIVRAEDKQPVAFTKYGDAVCFETQKDTTYELL